ncbi:sigma-70 family RNA polymerase sigma factor [Sphingobacterium sp. DR205]|uniref:RNA polymerase sigma factor n=1 Tax=Sphingobacterium sp. DR205 TaxID=2713573 RepID=UPI0013E442EE|nr:sigma-70 family RNA polymerase sigma factor [Sphingobacterium sp. DR205]QIH34469.1 sigma-70 family RNA polymerase sigma factor [Sphingobacterium sp. DR205]
MMMNSDNMTQDFLALKFAEGDRHAFSEIFHKFQPALVFFANRMIFRYHLNDAEEIVQDIFVKLYDKRASFKTFESVKAFLYISAKNACLNRIEKEKVRLRRYDHYIAAFDESEDKILNDMIYSEVVREISSEIDLLPTKCRQIMKQFFEQDRSTKEIAEDLEITVSTVKAQKARAISILKKRLSGAGIAFLLINL